MSEEYTSTLSTFYRSHKRMPSYSEMMKLFGFKSKNAVYRLVEKMVEAGIVSKDHLGRLLPSTTFDQLPLLGLVKAGLPASAEEVRETVSLNDLLVPPKQSCYLLEVDGDSMIDAHIAPGDLVLVRSTTSARDGDIVIAEVDGEFTMKFFREKDNKVWLEPANKNYKPIHPRYDLKVSAVVISVIRRY